MASRRAVSRFFEFVFPIRFQDDDVGDTNG